MNDNNYWFIESISLTQATTPPTKEDMEKVLPLSWPPRWQEIERQSRDGWVRVRIGHLNPDPENPILDPEEGGFSKFDFKGDLSILGYGDDKTARQFFESYQTIPTQGLSAPTPGASTNIPLGDLLKTFAPNEMMKEIESALEKGRKELVKHGAFEKGKYLGEEAIFQVGETGCMAVLINNFVITGTLLFDFSPPWPASRSDLMRRLHQMRQDQQSIFNSIFSRIKGEKKEMKDAEVEITRGPNKINNPKEKFEADDGDIIKTGMGAQVNIADSAGNKMWISGGSRVKINEPSNFELLMGTVTAFINKLKLKTKFEIHTATASLAIRGTIFSIYTDKDVTSLTVVEGEAEFSDLKGTKVIVKSNQSCFYSKEQGLQGTFTVPVNLKDQFRGV